MRIRGMMIGLLLLLAGVTACEPDLSKKPRAVTKDHRTAICARLGEGGTWSPSARKGAGKLVGSRVVGHLIKLPPGEEVIVLTRDGEFIRLRFINKPAYPDVWAHVDAVEMRK